MGNADLARQVALRRRAPARGVAACATLLTLGACNPSSDRARRAPPPADSATPPAVAPASSPPASTAAEPRSPEPPASGQKDDKPVENGRFVLDDLNDVGPAAPAAAFAQGVVMVTRADELVLAKLSRPLGKSKKPAAGSIEHTTRDPSEFWPVARGPAVSATHAYWISKGRLVRRALAGGALEILETDAREGTRVALAGAPEAVAYVTRPTETRDSVARLRLHDGRKLELTPEGAAASSVSLARVGDDLIASFIDGRTGMTPVHARRFRTKSGELEPDVVVWVAGATQGMTELSSVGGDAHSWLLMPVEKDASHFGLATLALDHPPKMDPPLRWRTYANGLDRAPAAAAVVCGAPVAVYARPADARPAASQELVLSELTLAETAGSETLATARGFADVSLYPVPEGALLAYVADRRTWARSIRCR